MHPHRQRGNHRELADNPNHYYTPAQSPDNNSSRISRHSGLSRGSQRSSGLSNRESALGERDAGGSDRSSSRCRDGKPEAIVRNLALFFLGTFSVLALYIVLKGVFRNLKDYAEFFIHDTTGQADYARSMFVNLIVVLLIFALIVAAKQMKSQRQEVSRQRSRHNP